MLGKRRVSKRLSQKKVEASKSNFESKKRKIDSVKSVYFDPGGSDEDVDEDSSTNGFNKMDEDLITNENKNEENSVLSYNSIKSKSLSESESSSDEFDKAPISLDELGGFEVLKKNDSTSKKESIPNGDSITSSNLSGDSDIEDKAKPVDDYYDFSQIIKTQELITTMKKEFDEVKQEEQDPSKKSSQNLKQKRLRQKCKPETTTKTKKCEKANPGVNDLDVSQLLAMAEGTYVKNEIDDIKLEPEDPEVINDVARDGVEVTIQLPNMQKKKKSKVDIEAAMKRRINLVRKENQVLMHQVHLLCWIAHGNHLNNMLNNDELMGLALSLIPSQHCYPPKHTNLNYLEKLVEWFIKKIIVNQHEESLISIRPTTIASLQKQIALKISLSYRDLALIFVCMLRSLGIHTRLVINLRVISLKPPTSQLFVVSTKPETEKKDVKNTTKNSTASKTKTANSQTKKKDAEIKGKKDTAKNKAPANIKTVKSIKPNKTESNNSIYFSSSDENPLKTKSGPSKGKSSEYFSSSDEKPLKLEVDENKRNKSLHFKPPKNMPRNKTKLQNKGNIEDPSLVKTQENEKVNILNKPSTSKSSKEELRSKPTLANIKRSLREKKVVRKSYVEKNSSSSEDDNDKKPSSKRVSRNVSDQVEKSNEKKSSRKSGRESKFSSQNADESDGDFELPSVKKQNKSARNKSIDRRVLSSDDEADDETLKKIGVDYWVEVFLEEEEKWISVDLTRGRVHCISKIYSLATHPVRYVLAWNNDKTIKDITRRYTPHWLTVTRKQRVNQDWLDKALASYAPPKNARDREEDEDLDRQLQDKPLPTSVSEYKNHPLYALQRHLLKFEAIYPPNAPTVGFVRGESVYPRSCVVGLHTKETWIKEAKRVMKGEEPYKVVKARPKYDKLSGNVINNLPLPLFGHWQVEDYVPPPAVDGKVPRNEYGNVELYKPCMLPPGTVHLQIPCVNRVARKLNIDCAPAVVGWDFHCGASHPVMDGFVVCEEFKDTLLDAWNQEMDESARRAKEKVEQRVYGNWRRLIKGLLIRERLNLRYDFGTVPSEPDKAKKKKSGQGHHKRK